MNYTEDFAGAEGLNFPPNGERLYQEDFIAEHDGVFDEISGRETDILSPGVLYGFECTVGTSSVVIAAGAARDSLLRRIKSSGPVTVDIPNGTTVKILIRHKWANQEFLPDGASKPKIRRIHSCGIVAIDDNAAVSPADVLLWDVSRVGTTITVNADLRALSRISCSRVGNPAVVVNAGETGNGVTKGTAGIEVDRGTVTKYFIGYSESAARIVAGLIGALKKVIIEDDIGHGSGKIPVADGVVCENLNADKVDGLNASAAATANTVAARDGNADLTARKLVSTIAPGTSPFVVNSSTKVTNLNADKVDGYDSGNASGNIPINNGAMCANLYAEFAEVWKGEHLEGTLTGAQSFEAFTRGKTFSGVIVTPCVGAIVGYVVYKMEWRTATTVVFTTHVGGEVTVTKDDTTARAIALSF